MLAGQPATVRKFGDRHGEVEALRSLGDTLRALGRDLEAQATWQDALAICEPLGFLETGEIRDRLVALSSTVAQPPGSG